MLTRRRSDWGTRNSHQRIFRKVWTIYKKSWPKRRIFYDSNEIEIRLPFYSSLSIFLDIFGGLWTQLFIQRHGERGNLKSFESQN